MMSCLGCCPASFMRRQVSSPDDDDDLTCELENDMFGVKTLASRTFLDFRPLLIIPTPPYPPLKNSLSAKTMCIPFTGTGQRDLMCATSSQCPQPSIKPSFLRALKRDHNGRIRGGVQSLVLKVQTLRQTVRVASGSTRMPTRVRREEGREGAQHARASLQRHCSVTSALSQVVLLSFTLQQSVTRPLLEDNHRNCVFSLSHTHTYSPTTRQQRVSKNFSLEPVARWAATPCVCRQVLSKRGYIHLPEVSRSLCRGCARMSALKVYLRRWQRKHKYKHVLNVAATCSLS